MSIVPLFKSTFLSTLILGLPLMACAGSGSDERDPSGGGKSDSLTPCDLQTGSGCDAHEECLIDPNSGCIDNSCPGVCVERAIEISEVCVAGSNETIPSVTELGYESEPCLVWNRSEDDERFATIGYKSLDDLTVQQLRLTLDYFCDDFCTYDVDEMTVEQLMDEGDDPYFYLIHDTEEELLYSVVNIASGDTPLELVFRYGTLDPVAVTEDGDLSYCRPDLVTD